MIGLLSLRSIDVIGTDMRRLQPVENKAAEVTARHAVERAFLKRHLI